jgi:hypothetical protein
MKPKTRISSAKYEYLNERFQCNNGEWFTIIEYNKNDDITIQFDDGTKMFKQRSGSIKKGNIKNPNHIYTSNSLIPTVYDIGYLGIGKFTPKDYKKYYDKWYHMIQRCYSENKQLTAITYIGCSIDPIWHNFQNFCLYCEDPINGYIEGFDLDKDILFKGNKVYGSDTCCFVPSEINNLFTKSNNKRGKYPIGITLTQGKFRVRLMINGIKKDLGSFYTIDKAFQTYKEAKEKQIQWMALTWFKQKKMITEKVFNAIMLYQVEITD